MDKKRFLGFSLIEMLIVLAVIIVLGSLGAGAFLGFRETALVRENVESLKQDILQAQHMAMNVKKGEESNWIYGVGIDLGGMDISGSYRYMRWCSQFQDFGDPRTRAPLPGWDTTRPIGHQIVTYDFACYFHESMFCYYYCPSFICPPGDLNCCRIRCGSSYYRNQCINNCPSGNFACMVFNYNVDFSPPNAYLTLVTSETCQPNLSTLSVVSGYEFSRLTPIAENISIIGDARYILFEAVTGRAFLYDATGKPVNYSGDIDNLSYDDSKVLEILIERKRSNKFDIVTVYPISGTVVHHVYSDADLDSSCSAGDSGCINVDGNWYRKYTLQSEIESYRP